jgi:hypothetical protein
MTVLAVALGILGIACSIRLPSRLCLAIANWRSSQRAARRPGCRARSALVAAPGGLKLGRIHNCAVQPEM